MGFALQVLEPTQNGPGGEVPILVHEAATSRVWVISGQGPAPSAATPEAFGRLGIQRIPPDGLLAACVPGALDAWCQLLERFGSRSLETVLAPARDLAARGFPMYPFLRGILRYLEPRFRSQWPSSAAIYSPVPANGERLRNPELADFFDALIRVEKSTGGSREAGIRAARNHFYRGEPAERVGAFLQQPVEDVSRRAHAGLLCAQDFFGYTGAIEEPVQVDYRGATVFKCPPWSQGPVLLQQLRLLEGFDLISMGRRSTDALHTWIECAKLAFADREACYADPAFEKVPVETLLSREYAELRRGLIDPESASTELRPGLGRLPEGWPWLAEAAQETPVEPQALAAARGRSDTTQCVAADAAGNLVSATPSGGWIPTSPVVPGLGFPVGTRAQMFCLDPEHPGCIAPGKRPRTTLSPSLAWLPDGRRLAFGTPGGDQQDQWNTLFFLELAEFGCSDLQEAIDAPTVHSLHMPSSFYPREAEPCVVSVEERVAPEVRSALENRGHRPRPSGPWSHGRVMAVSQRPDGGLLEAAASPRFQVAWAATLP